METTEKNEIMLDLLRQLMDTMKESDGKSLMPKHEEEIEVVEPKKGSMEDALDAIPEPDSDDSDPEMDDEDCEPKTGASARLNRLMKR